MAFCPPSSSAAIFEAASGLGAAYRGVTMVSFNTVIQRSYASRLQPLVVEQPIVHHWYTDNIIDHKLSSEYVITDGFEVTKDEYHAAHHFLTDLVYNIRNEDLRQDRVVLWPIMEKFIAGCPFWAKKETSRGRRIPEVWKQKCLEGWIKKIGRNMMVRQLPLVPSLPFDEFPNVAMGPMGQPYDGCLGCRWSNCAGHGRILTLEAPFKMNDKKPKGWA